MRDLLLELGVNQAKLRRWDRKKVAAGTAVSEG